MIVQVVHKKMEGLGPVHHKNGVHAHEHMPVFETVINAMMEQVSQNDAGKSLS